MADETEMSTAAEMTAYQKWEHSMLEDVSHDTDAIIRMLGRDSMSESYDSGLLTGMLAQKGVDPSIIAMLENNRGAFGFDLSDWYDKYNH